MGGRIKSKEKQSIGEVVEGYLSARPLLLHYIHEGLVNLSALARKIKKELKLRKSVEAVLMALYRSGHLKGRAAIHHPAEILEKSEISIRTGYAVIVSKVPLKLEAEADVHLASNYLYILPRAKVPKNLSRGDVISFRQNLVLVEFIHPIEVEDTPGVVFHILARFYEMGISVVELLSMWDRTFLLIEEGDGRKVVEMLLRDRLSH